MTKSKIKELPFKNIKVKDLKPYKNNSKIHSPQHIAFLKSSILKEGLLEHIVVGTKNVIVSGHCRALALLDINPNKIISVKDASLLPIRSQKKLRILYNKSVSTDYDKDILQQELENIYQDISKNHQKIIDELNVTADDIGDLIETKNIDEEVKKLTGPGMVRITIEVPKKFKDKVKKYFSNGDASTAKGMGKGVLKRLKLL